MVEVLSHFEKLSLNQTLIFNQKESERSIFSLYTEAIQEVKAKLRRHPNYEYLQDVFELQIEMINYHLDSKTSRGIFTPLAFGEINPNATKKEIWLANILGVYVDLAYAYSDLLINLNDDVEEQRGKPTWHAFMEKNNEVTKQRILCDPLLISAAGSFILHEYFEKEPQFERLLSLSIDTNLKRFSGKIFDNVITNESYFTKNFSRLSFDEWLEHFGNSNASLPFLFAYTLANKSRNKKFDKLIRELDTYSLIRENFQESFIDRKTAMRYIDLGRISFPIVAALENASNVEKETIRKHYGKPGGGPEGRREIFNVFHKLGIEENYAEFEKTALETILTLIDELPENSCKSSLRLFLPAPLYT